MHVRRGASYSEWVCPGGLLTGGHYSGIQEVLVGTSVYH